ncbi:MAG: N(4)-(beta-N-acetylglucosaminyl)-L-asparaginase [Bdellovibrionota bacterium]|nr:N(4)-(beta-N-acetylglucosaminyl)-L-asparaginase [Deltaproteobacteria bacterium]
MNQDRRSFFYTLLHSTFGIAAGTILASRSSYAKSRRKTTQPGLVLSTWKHGVAANAAAWDIIVKNGAALDAVEAGARLTEANPEGRSVGLGGRPDREGIVTLDACIMDQHGNAGSVAFLQDIKHPISVARKVMQETPHVMLVGKGAQQFALQQGFRKENLLTEATRKEYQQWRKKSQYQPIINIENHDTIGVIAQDQHGNLSGACTTSGLGYKMHGRVGDSPIIGAGLFVDNEVGAAAATGTGEAVMKTCGSFLIVERMRQGASPMQACKEAVLRIVKHQDYRDMQVAYIAINKQGEYGAFSIRPGFPYAIKSHDLDTLQPSDAYVQK